LGSTWVARWTKRFGWVRCLPAGFVVLGLIFGAACQQNAAFHCSNSTQCGDGGICEPVGYCSFSDAACESTKRRYDEFAGPWSAECVDPTTASETGEGPGPDDASGDETSATVDPSTSAGETEGPVDPQTTGDEAPLEAGESDPGSETGTTPDAGCSDDRRNGDESDIDCGGGCGPTCENGRTCLDAMDCVSGICQSQICVSLSNCSDGEQNGDETDADCGGSVLTCPRCEDGLRCLVEADCGSGRCTGERCTSCVDQAANGDETDVDCGGSCAECSVGQSCIADADCTSGTCSDGACCGGSQVHCTRCAERLSLQVNCSDVPISGDQSNCTRYLQCLADNPEVCTTRSAPGCTNDPGGVCNPALFGGSGGGGERQVLLVLQNAQCQP